MLPFAAVARAAPAGTGLPDVRVVIDISGSMKQNDPDNLRQPAVELLLRLLPERSQAGIWTFGRQVNMLVPHRPVTDEWRREAGQLSRDIQSVGLYTNIGEALEKAAYDAQMPDTRYRTSIILLTDGMVDIDKDPEANQREQQRIINEVLPKITHAGYRIHTIALSNNADRELMEKLSLATGGIAATAHSADDLMRIFLRAFDASAPAQQVPLQGKSFVVDGSIKEFTVLIFHQGATEPIKLMGPDGKTWQSASSADEINWYSATDYDLVTVKRPETGEWRVDTPQDILDPASRVTVISNLNLRVEPMPNNLWTGDAAKLLFRLEDKGETLTRPDFLSLMSIDARLESVNDDKVETLWSRDLPAVPVPREGKYDFQLPRFDDKGLYRLVLLVDGKSFTRQFTHEFNIRRSATVIPPESVPPDPVSPRQIRPVENSQPVTQNHADNIKPSPDKVPPPSPEPQALTPPVESGESAWVVYGVLVVVNLAIFAAAYFGYRFIMGGIKWPRFRKKKDSMKDAADGKPEEGEANNEVDIDPPADLEAQQATSQEDPDEEPPMDDLDSAINELNSLPEFSGQNPASADEEETIPGTELDDLDRMSIDNQSRTEGEKDKGPK